MKNSIILSLSLLAAFASNGQIQKTESIAVLHMESENYILNSEELTKVAVYELRKMNEYHVLDQAAVAEGLKGKKINPAHCATRTCAEKAGLALGVDKVIVGSVEFFEGRLVVITNLYDAKGLQEPRTQLSEFEELEADNRSMIYLALCGLLQIEPSPKASTNIKAPHPTHKLDVSQGAPRLALSGPRSGMTYMSGSAAEVFTMSKEEGGYDAMPVMFQVGYQFEKQYLNEGNFQALVEIIPTITGLDQGLAIPGLTVLHGLRSNKSGWEFAFGPTINVVKKAQGYYDENGAWQLNSQWNEELNGPNPHKSLFRLDSRGDNKLSSSFLIAAGKSFKSGRVNIPVNAYFVPQKDGWRAGVSFGFNSKKARR